MFDQKGVDDHPGRLVVRTVMDIMQTDVVYPFDLVPGKGVAQPK
ncbi:hypothetical protein [Segatella cerevisiae]|nr:hypothetical protein [Segatella cerevisiae]